MRNLEFSADGPYPFDIGCYSLRYLESGFIILNGSYAQKGRLVIIVLTKQRIGAA